MYNANIMTTLVSEVNGSVDYVLRDKPLRVWPLSGDFLDYSGYGYDATSTGAPTAHLPLVTSLDSAVVFSNSAVGQFDAGIFAAGQEDYTFALAVSFRTIKKTTGLSDSDGPQQVLGHSGQMDGIVVNGSVVSFSTKYVGGKEVVVSYDTKTEMSVHAVAVHTNEKNSLYVNGVLVAEKDIPEDVRGLAYVANDGKLYSGTSTSTRALAVNMIVVYNFAPSQETISNNFSLMGTSASLSSLSSVLRGHDISLSREGWDKFIEREWNSQDSWSAGSYLLNAAVVSGNVYPQVANGVTLAGIWKNSIELDSTDATNIYGVNFDWDGMGVAIEVSLDGSTWTEVQRLRNVSVIPNGFLPTETILHVRAKFTAGLDPALAELRSLRVWGFTDGDFSVDKVSLLFNAASPMSPADYLSLSNDWGVYLSNGSVTLSTATGSSEVIRTVEVWSRSTTALTFSKATTNIYVNGAAGSHIPGEWIVRHYVLSENLTSPLVISGTGQIGKVVVYDTALSAADISSVVESYFSIPTTTVASETTINVTEMPEGTEIYAHDWTITGAG